MSHTFFKNVAESIDSALRKTVTKVEFIETLTNDELLLLNKAVQDVARDRQLDLTIVQPQTAAEQFNDLVNKFGHDGNLQLGNLNNTDELPPVIEQTAQYPFKFEKDKVGEFVIIIPEKAINVNILMAISKAFKDNGVTDGYRVGDDFYLYVEKIDPAANVYFYNETKNQAYNISSDLASFTKWYESVLAIVNANVQQFNN